MVIKDDYSTMYDYATNEQIDPVHGNSGLRSHSSPVLRHNENLILSAYGGYFEDWRGGEYLLPILV